MNKHVKKFGERYRAIQQEGKSLRAELKPLLAKLVRFCEKCAELQEKGDNDIRLYNFEDGCNCEALLRLHNFDYYDLVGAAEGIDTFLFNIVNTPFVKLTSKKDGDK